ncbi:hypothetical protein ACSSS7_004520 [Eimeria intestinalis]
MSFRYGTSWGSNAATSSGLPPPPTSGAAPSNISNNSSSSSGNSNKVGNNSNTNSSSNSSSSSSSSSGSSSSGGGGGNRSRSYKTVLLGDASVGKSSLVIRFVKNTFSDAMETTIGAAFFAHSLEVDGSVVKFEIWDTAGQERFSSLAPMYYRGAAAAVVVYDQCNSASFERAQMWVQQLQLSGNPNIVIALAANKTDLANRQVDPNIGRQYAEENGLLFVETSARTGHNVNRLFQMIARRLPETKTTTGCGVQTVQLTADNNNNAHLLDNRSSSLSSRMGCCTSSS